MDAVSAAIAASALDVIVANRIAVPACALFAELEKPTSGIPANTPAIVASKDEEYPESIAGSYPIATESEPAGNCLISPL